MSNYFPISLAYYGSGSEDDDDDDEDEAGA